MRVTLIECSRELRYAGNGNRGWFMMPVDLDIRRGARMDHGFSLLLHSAH